MRRAPTSSSRRADVRNRPRREPPRTGRRRLVGHEGRLPTHLAVPRSTGGRDPGEPFPPVITTIARAGQPVLPARVHLVTLRLQADRVGIPATCRACACAGTRIERPHPDFRGVRSAISRNYAETGLLGRRVGNLNYFHVLDRPMASSLASRWLRLCRGASPAAARQPAGRVRWAVTTAVVSPNPKDKSRVCATARQRPATCCRDVPGSATLHSTARVPQRGGRAGQKTSLRFIEETTARDISPRRVVDASVATNDLLG